MKCCTYIYGRTLNIDFREICTPRGGLSTKTVSLIEQLINTDVASNGGINRLRYLFVREPQQVLFGVGFNHCQYLDNSHWTDLTGTRKLRSFVGIVIDNEEFDRLTSIPIDYGFFVDLYLKNISSVWELEDRPKNRKVLISDTEEFVKSDTWCKLDGSEIFNTNEKLCRFFAPSKEESIIRSLKNCHSSVLIGLNVESHVISAFRKFNVIIPNAMCLDTKTNYDFELVIANQEQMESTNKNITQDYRPQKRTKLPLDKRRSNSDTETRVGNSTYEPAILSSLKNYELSESDNVDKKQLSANDLMSIDWGDDAVESPKFSNIIPNSGNLDETIEEDNSDFMEDSSGLTSMDFSGRKANTDDKPKKVVRPKSMLIIVCVVIIMLLIVVLFAKRIRKSEHSTSGKKDVDQTELVLPSSTLDSVKE